MKKLSSLILGVVITSVCFSQVQYGTPSWVPQSNVNQTTGFKGAVQTWIGFIDAVYTDTTTANSAPQNIKNIPFFNIATSDGNKWFRSADISHWIKIATGSLSTPTLQQVLVTGNSATLGINLTTSGRNTFQIAPASPGNISGSMTISDSVASPAFITYTRSDLIIWPRFSPSPWDIFIPHSNTVTSIGVLDTMALLSDIRNSVPNLQTVTAAGKTSTLGIILGNITGSPDLLALGATNLPSMSFKQTTTGQVYKFRIGDGSTSPTYTGFNLIDSLNNKLVYRTASSGDQFIVGNYPFNESAPFGSKMLLYGGNSGANLDSRGDATTDQSTFECENHTYDSIMEESVRMQEYGDLSTASDSTMGYPKIQLGELAFKGNLNNLIFTEDNQPLRFGTNNHEVFDLLTDGQIKASYFYNNNDTSSFLQSDPTGNFIERKIYPYLNNDNLDIVLNRGNTSSQGININDNDIFDINTTNNGYIDMSTAFNGSEQGGGLEVADSNTLGSFIDAEEAIYFPDMIQFHPRTLHSATQYTDNLFFPNPNGVNRIDTLARLADIRAASTGGTVTNVTGVNTNGFTWSIANSSTTPALTLLLQNANASQSGQLTSTDWNIFNGKQSAISLTTNNRGGVSTFISNTLNIPNYVAATGDSMSYVWFPSQTTSTPVPINGTTEYDSLNKQTVKNSANKIWMTSLSMLTAGVPAIDSIPYAGIYLMRSDTGGATPIVYPYNTNPLHYSKIVASDTLFSLSGARSIDSLNAPASGFYNVNAFVNVTGGSLDVMNLMVTYKDENNNAASVNLRTAITTSAGYRPGTIAPIWVHSGTKILISTSLTTSTGTITYDAAGYIELIK